MLLIARRTGEGIQIGPDIEIKIVRSSRSRVIVAITAPRALKILRVDAAEDDKPRSDGHELPERAANETIRQRRYKLASR